MSGMDRVAVYPGWDLKFEPQHHSRCGGILEQARPRGIWCSVLWNLLPVPLGSLGTSGTGPLQCVCVCGWVGVLAWKTTETQGVKHGLLRTYYVPVTG